MSTTLLRLGLWILIAVLVLYVAVSTYPNEPWAELITVPLLTQAMLLAGILVIAGIVLRILGKGAKVVSKNRCRVCRTPIPSGGIYCREHLRSILSDEDEKTHMTRTRQ